MSIQRLFVADRGEIAVRILRAARTLGIRTVCAEFPGDAGSLPLHLADAAVAVPAPSRAPEVIEAIVDAAAAAGCDAVHPGTGTLAECAPFAARVADAGMAFVGPSAEVIERMADKVRAREAARALGIKVVPGTFARATLAEARAVAQEIGFPVVVKAAAGDGGRGVRLVATPSAFDRSFEDTAREAETLFGDAGLYVEKLIHPARHVEVQVLGDGHFGVHLFERECSLQRRRQKVWEEAPCTALDRRVRAELLTAALRLATEVGYSGAGTVEFLLNEKKGKFYFLEMNTRLQAEHTVTELVTGVDIVAETLKIAGGDPLELYQDDLEVRGHAIEVRLAADAADLPARVNLRIPGGPFIRWDSAQLSGGEMAAADPLIGKLVAWGGDRGAALDRLAAALSEVEVAPVRANASMLRTLAATPEVRDNEVSVTFLDRWLDGKPQ